jgi:hypothetical protein
MGAFPGGIEIQFFKRRDSTAEEILVVELLRGNKKPQLSALRAGVSVFPVDLRAGPVHCPPTGNGPSCNGIAYMPFSVF